MFVKQHRIKPNYFYRHYKHCINHQILYNTAMSTDFIFEIDHLFVFFHNRFLKKIWYHSEQLEKVKIHRKFLPTLNLKIWLLISLTSFSALRGPLFNDNQLKIVKMSISIVKGILYLSLHLPSFWFLRFSAMYVFTCSIWPRGAEK